MPEVPSSPWVYLIGLLITSGFAKYAVDLYREHQIRREASRVPGSARQAEIDQSMLTMAKVNKTLDDDNHRLRESNHELDSLLSSERSGRAADRESYQREIRELEDRIRQMSTELAELLRQVGSLRKKHDTDEFPAIGGGESRTRRGGDWNA